MGTYGSERINRDIITVWSMDPGQFLNALKKATVNDSNNIFYFMSLWVLTEGTELE